MFFDVNVDYDFYQGDLWVLSESHFDFDGILASHVLGIVCLQNEVTARHC